MSARPLQADGPTFEDDPPYTFGEIIATAEDDHGLLLALAMARAWPEGVPERDLEPWQRIGPDVLWMVYKQDMARWGKIHAETVAYLGGLTWVIRKKLSARQIECAASDAIDRMVTGQCTPSDIAALAVAMRVDTYLNLRAEGVGFLVNCMSVAQFGVEIALGKRPEV